LRELLEQVIPVGVHLNNFLLLSFSISSIPYLLAVLESLVHFLWVQGVGDIEEVLSCTLPTLGILVGEVVLHSWQLDPAIIQVDHAYLVVAGWVAGTDITQPKEFLFIFEYLL
jgi:hypothetical protein